MAVGGAASVLVMEWEVKAGGGQAGTGVGGRVPSLEDDGGVSVAAVYLTCSEDLTGVDGS